MEHKDTSTLLRLQKRTQITRQLSGFTLVEIMVVVVILSLLTLFAAPDLKDWRAKMNLKSVGEDLYADMQLAKMHAIKNNINVVFTITPAVPCPGGSYSFDEPLPSATNVVTSAAMPNGVCISASTFVAGEGFTSRGLPIGAGGGTVTVTHTNLAGTQYVITQSVAGGIKLD